MLQLRTILSVIGPVVLAVSEHDGVVFLGEEAFTRSARSRQEMGKEGGRRAL